MVGQLDVAAAAGAGFAATVGALSPTHRVTVSVRVDRRQRLGVAVTAAVSGRSGSNERRVGAVLT